MEELVTPDSLDELDRRVYDLAIQHIPLAEIAVRLGVPVLQADERLQRVFSRLRVADRAALRALSEGPLTAPPEVEAEAAVEDLEIVAATPERAFPRRRLLGVAVAAGVTALAGVGALGWRTRTSNAPEAGEPDGTASVGTALPGGDAALVPFDIQPGPGAPETWESRAFHVDQDIGWAEGLFLMSLSTPQIYGYRFTSDDDSRWSGYRTLAGDSLVYGEGTNGRAQLILRYDTKRSWSWKTAACRLLAAYSSSALGPFTLMFAATSAGQFTGTFHFVRIEGDGATETSRIAVEELRATNLDFHQSPTENRVVCWFGGEVRPPQIRIFDVPQGAEIARIPVEPADGKGGTFLRGFQATNEGFLVRYGTNANGRGDIPGTYYSRASTWSGDSPAPRVDQGDGYVSPDLAWRVFESRRSYQPGPTDEVFSEPWPSLSVYSSREELAYQVRSASVTYGDRLPERRWLADSSGFVAMLRSEASDELAENGYEYGMVVADGSSITRLPVPPRFRDSRPWFEIELLRGPVPSPFDARYLAFGRLQLYDRRRGSWVSARIPLDSGPAHLDPWSAGPGWMVFALPHAGHGGTSGPLLLPPKVDVPALDAPGVVIVAGTGDGLNLRLEPSQTGEVVGVLPDGTVLKQFPNGSRPRGQPFHERNAEGDWLYVQAEGIPSVG